MLMRYHSLVIEIPEVDGLILAQNPTRPPNGTLPFAGQGLLCLLHDCRGSCFGDRTSTPPLPEQVRPIQCRQNPKVAHMAKVAFLGLGVMGFPMAGHLAKKGGHEVTVYNRNPAKAKAWVEKFGGKSAPTPKAAAEGQDFVMCCVGNDNDLRAVTLGDNGAFAGMKKGATFVDHTTASAEVARELDAAATKAGFKFIDAPVSGGSAGAENGVLTVMCGGTPDTYAGAEPIIAAYARMCKLLGPAGSGQLTKMVNQICIAGV